MRYSKNLVTAIVIVIIPGEQRQGKKFRNIKNVDSSIQKLEKFAREKIPFADHINLYSKETKEFLRQIKL